MGAPSRHGIRRTAVVAFVVCLLGSSDHASCDMAFLAHRALYINQNHEAILVHQAFE